MNKIKYILSIDQGTTGSRAFIFNSDGKAVASAYKEFKQYFPKPGWVEHDAEEIWQSCVAVIKQVIRNARISPRQIAAIGITNQRETTVLWNRKTSKPVYHAIVWQCRRTASICDQLRKYEKIFKRKTGLVLDAYFSGTKIKWLLDNVLQLRQRAQKGDIAFGTIDSWLIWKLTGGKSHATDTTNASRTLIYNIRKFQWDHELCRILNVPLNILPNVQEPGSIFGYTSKNVAGLPDGVPIAGVLGDQQAALYGQGCFEAGSIKNTYGTGCFLVLNTGKKFITSKHGLLTTIASDAQGKSVYALEGSVFIAGAVVQWLRDQLKIISKSSETEKIAQSVKDTAGVYVVPAFAGLGAPYWNSHVRGIICGLTRGASKEHIVRAALESIAYQTKDVFDVMQKELGRTISELRVDGGACQNNFLMQFQADILNCRIIRPKMIESTAKGAAQLAAVTVKLSKLKIASQKNAIERIFIPSMNNSIRQKLTQGWQKAVRQDQTI